MPTIPFPNVPAYPGVPQLTRPVSAAIASNPALSIALGSVETLLGSALQQAPQWGIFDTFGNQLGLSTVTTTQALLSAAESLVTGQSAPVLSVRSLEYGKEMRVADFVVELGGFASYNKVELPANPIVQLALAGSQSDRTTFLNAIDAAVKSTTPYNVLTPEVKYVGYTLERYTYQRRAYQGVTLLVVDVTLKEIRQVSASYTTSSTAAIVNPQNAAATPQVNNGATQPATPDTSTLRSVFTKLGIN